MINGKIITFFEINIADDEKRPLHLHGKTIDYKYRYKYLGSWFTDDGKSESALKLHEPDHLSSVNKFAIFCHTNTSMPYHYKSLVMEAAVVSSVFYSCETWLLNNTKQATEMYNKMIRCLLVVRVNTSRNYCLIESRKSTSKAYNQP